jgi:hypothetical protein
MGSLKGGVPRHGEWQGLFTGLDTLRDFTVNVAASIAFAIAGVLTYRFIYLPLLRRSNILARSLPFDFSSKSITISYGLVTPSPGSVYYTVEEGDLSAINFAVNAFAATFGRERVTTVNCYVAEAHLSQITNILSVSGPRWNRVTENYMGRLGSPATFERTDALVVKPLNSPETRYHATTLPSGDEQVCYGFVLAGEVATSDGRKQHVAICAGLNNLSTYGAVVFLASLRNKYRYKGVRGLDGKKLGRQWVVIIRVENTTNPTVSRPYRVPLDPSRITIDVVDIIRSDRFLPPYVYRF